MKTIAVLTDLSKPAEQATQFALHMAKKMKANVLLFHVCSVTAPKQLVLSGAQEPFPVQPQDLMDFGMRMAQELVARTFPGSYLPEVQLDRDNSEIVDVMTAIMQNGDINLVITTPGTQNDMVDYLLSDECTRIIDWATVPVLIVPKNTPLRNMEKITFASQLHEEDINSIAELGCLLESFAAELMVAHLNSDPSDPGVRTAEKQLNSDLYKKLDCGGVYFRSIADVDQHKNWDWLKANKKTDLLAVVQQPREQMARFFKRGCNEAVTYHLTLPVMVLPKRP